jgi:coenzyme PQQ synthesis protein D (PqqD)
MRWDTMKIARNPNIVFEMFDDQAVIVGDSDEELLTLNPVATLIWTNIEEPTPIDALESKLFDLFEGVTREQWSTDLKVFVDQLVSEGLVVEA